MDFKNWIDNVTPLKLIWATGYGSEMVFLRSHNSAGIWFRNQKHDEGFAPWTSVLSLREVYNDNA